MIIEELRQKMSFPCNKQSKYISKYVQSWIIYIKALRLYAGLFMADMVLKSLFTIF